MAAERSTDNEELILAIRPQNTKATSIHTMVVLLFFGTGSDRSAKPYKSFENCSTFAVSLFRGAKETYWQGLK